MNYIENARKLRKVFINIASTLDDVQASSAPQMFPRLKEDGTLIPAKTRINWNGVLKRAAVDLWDTKANNPDNASTLWEELDCLDGYRIIPEIITAVSAFSEGECGWWNGVLYRSKVNGNVYTPSVYPNNWEQI